MNASNAFPAKPLLPQHWGLSVGHALLLLLALISAGPALAQTVYRIVGPDGRVTFSDVPPADGPAVTPANSQAASQPSSQRSATPTAALPFNLRQVVSRYPVTIYTSNRCVPCNSARKLLVQRGIPFAEKTVNTPPDAEALMQLSGEIGLPLLTIGTQQIKGFSETEWNQYLSAAGYPAQSQLPFNYQRPPATPLSPETSTKAAASPADTAADSTETSLPARTTPPITPPVDNPARIRF